MQRIDFISGFLWAALLLLACAAAKAQTTAGQTTHRDSISITLRPDFKKHFDACEIQGSTTIVNLRNGE